MSQQFSEDILLRILYAIYYGFKKRYELKQMLVRKSHVYNSVVDIEPGKIESLGIKALVLDFDGVLASHGELYPNTQAVNWLKKVVKANPQMPIFIFSNKPICQRISFFAKTFPNIEFLQNFPKKPYPNGLKHVCEKVCLNGSEVALVDDRVLTGLLATLLAGIQGIYISKPLIAFNKRPIKEAFFQLLRKVERFVF